MKYLLTVYLDEAVWERDTHPGMKETCTAESVRLCHELAAEGSYVHASPLHPVATATSIRIRDGKSVVTDGPFAETHEQLGGYFLVDVANLDEAMAIATRIPSAPLGTIEIRPLVTLDDLPAPSF